MVGIILLFVFVAWGTWWQLDDDLKKAIKGWLLGRKAGLSDDTTRIIRLAEKVMAEQQMIDARRDQKVRNVGEKPYRFEYKGGKDYLYQFGLPEPVGYFDEQGEYHELAPQLQFGQEPQYEEPIVQYPEIGGKNDFTT